MPSWCVFRVFIQLKDKSRVQLKWRKAYLPLSTESASQNDSPPIRRGHSLRDLNTFGLNSQTPTNPSTFLEKGELTDRIAIEPLAMTPGLIMSRPSTERTLPTKVCMVLFAKSNCAFRTHEWFGLAKGVFFRLRKKSPSSISHVASPKGTSISSDCFFYLWYRQEKQTAVLLRQRKRKVTGTISAAFLRVVEMTVEDRSAWTRGILPQANLIKAQEEGTEKWKYW